MVEHESQPEQPLESQNENISEVELLKAEVQILKDHHDVAAKYYGKHMDDDEARHNVNEAYSKLTEAKAKLNELENIEE